MVSRQTREIWDMKSRGLSDQLYVERQIWGDCQGPPEVVIEQRFVPFTDTEQELVCENK